MRPSSCQAQVVARTGCCREGVGNRDARAWKSRLLPSKSHLRSPQHCSSRGTTGDQCAPGANPSPNVSEDNLSPEPQIGSFQSGLNRTVLLNIRPSPFLPCSPIKVLIMTLCQSIESVARLPYLHPAPFYLPSPPLSVITGRSGGSGAAELVRAPPEGVDCLERLVRSQYLTPFSPSLHLLLLHKPQCESRGTLISDQEMYWSLSMSSHRGRGGARGALKAWQSWVCACARQP